MRHILVLLAIITCLNANTQSVFPTDPNTSKWNVLECFWVSCLTESYQFEYDTSICGQIYSKISFKESNLTGYIRSDSMKSYFRLSQNCAEKEYLMYDYSLNIGDTVFVGYNMGWYWEQDTMGFILEDIDTISNMGIERQRYKLSYDLTRKMNWIKGIGSETHPFYPFVCIHTGCEARDYLLCYDSAGVNLYLNPEFITCDTTIVGIDMMEVENELNVFPNPFDQYTIIETENINIQDIGLFSITGQKLRNIEFTKGTNLRIEVGNELDPGIYILRLNTNETTISRLLIKTKL